MTAALEPIGLTYKVPLGDVPRMVLLGNDERISVHTTLRIGLVSEVLAAGRAMAARAGADGDDRGEAGAATTVAPRLGRAASLGGSLACEMQVAPPFCLDAGHPGRRGPFN